MNNSRSLPFAVSRAIAVHVADSKWRAAVPNLVSRVREAAALALKQGNKSDSASGLTILLTGDEELRELNARYRKKNKPTNVLSFPVPTGSHYLGDIAIAFGTTAREAASEGTPLDHHLLHLVVHGVLHLMGYDHGKAREAAIMEALETRILGEMAIPDPYARPDPAVA